MTPLHEVILNKKTTINPIWVMRQAGRYLPEFRKIRKENPNFIRLCLNENLSSEITVQPLRRFEIDAAIIFSDILLVPFALGQTVSFNQNFGPLLGKLDLNKITLTKESDFIKKLTPVYKAIKITKEKDELKNKDLIGFVGAPWTILVYMLNKKSPKNNDVENYLNTNDKSLDNLLKIIIKFLKVHIDNQIKNGATIIQLFDSWAGLLNEKDYEKYIYDPSEELVDFIKSKHVPAICFPRGINNYKKYVNSVNPDVISIDYNVNPKDISESIDITVQGGLNPNFLLGSKEELERNVKKYLDVFKNKPYIFNLGHGVLPNTDPNMVEYLIKLVKNYS